MMFSRLIVFVLLSTSPFKLLADEVISRLYREHGIEGTLVIESLDGKYQYVHNIQRAKQRYTPASTFKIVNTLIALDTGIVGEDINQTIFKWDGKKRAISAWNHDQSLKSAFAVSCVWCYQTIALRVGKPRYLDYLNKIHYGNKTGGDQVTTFWLDNSLTISANEHISLLRAIYLQKLPFKKAHFATLRKVMFVESTPNYSLWAKSGFANSIGWYVGYLEANKKLWLFASNIQVYSDNDLPLRKQLVLDAFRVKKIINSRLLSTRP